MRALNTAVEATIREMNRNPTEATIAAYKAAFAAREAARGPRKFPRDFTAAARSGRRQHAADRCRR